jgi:hypothetical protein
MENFDHSITIGVIGRGNLTDRREESWENYVFKTVYRESKAVSFGVSGICPRKYRRIDYDQI